MTGQKEMPGMPRAHANIDAALRRLGGAEPRAGLEGRISAKLQGELRAARLAGQGRGSRRAPALSPLQTACAGLALIAAASGVLFHAEHRNPGPGVPVPLAMPGTGPGSGTGWGLTPSAARQVQLAPIAPVHPSSRGRAQHHTGAGRASIARDAHRAAGVAAPAHPQPLR